MAFTKESIFSKIGELLVELNDGYTTLSESPEKETPAAILLLEAKAKFLATHFEVLRQFSVDSGRAADAVDAVLTPNDQQAPEAAAVFFTPPIALEEPADKQPVEEEIVEVGEVSDDQIHEGPTVETPVFTEPDTPIAAKPLPEEQVTPHLFSSPAVQSQPEKEAVEISEVEEPEKKDDASVEASVEQPNERVVINEIIQEPKEIVIENEPVVAAEEAKPSRPLTLNEMLQQQRKAGFAQTPSAAPQPSKSQEKVVDLKSVINLNDKLLFIKDLFNGYSLAYSEAIELLNRYSTFAEADVFLQTNYALKNNWSDKPHTVEKLYAVLRKKFM